MDKEDLFKGQKRWKGNECLDLREISFEDRRWMLQDRVHLRVVSVSSSGFTAGVLLGLIS
jgi:hypothetical protein